ncbi:uncharacterized protein LOC124318276 [Daphnia pulicaria]|uniref:uncharacterized protein LOC124318235 n=1 Tax=Daphnia pulicaria TaxID=35523 RepID=UPI001EEA8BF2|nr:uncharacterized protein LOC124318235 [Daphnia pulicaria]XP_046638775.1 uncharacterized protein LOC124318276 [Daphnia pulicaria]
MLFPFWIVRSDHVAYILPRCRLFFLYVPAVRFVRNTSEQISLVKSELCRCCPIMDLVQPAGKGCSSCYLYSCVFRQMKKHEQLKFIVYVRVVAVRCGTLLQPMLVIDLSASNSIGRAVVV